MGISSLLGIADGGIQLAVKLLERSNNKDRRKYATELADLKTKLFAERRKPLSEQIDSDIEAWEDRIKAIQDVAMLEVKIIENDK